MRKQKEIITENYLERKPIRSPHINWKTESDGMVALEIENKGVFNRLAQLILFKPKISYIHLDETGSFVWPLLDGNMSIMEIGKAVDEHFGEAAHPLYERLVQFFRILDSYGFVEWNDNNS